MTGEMGFCVALSDAPVYFRHRQLHRAVGDRGDLIVTEFQTVEAGGLPADHRRLGEGGDRQRGYGTGSEGCAGCADEKGTAGLHGKLLTAARLVDERSWN
ncbi:hypothetical protein D9M70_598830 [compost metagenome]